MNTARAALLSHPPFSSSPSSLAVHSLVPEEPDKPIVLAWHPGDPLPTRAASVVARFCGRTHLLTVDDLQAPSGAGRVSSHLELDDSTSGYPTLTIEDMTSATSAPFSDAAFNRTILARGVRLADVACLPMSTGWFGAAEESRRRIKVHRAAEGAELHGGRGWAGWEFHLKPDPRAGVVVSVAGVEEKGRKRGVLYKGMASELFVREKEKERKKMGRRERRAGEGRGFRVYWVSVLENGLGSFFPLSV